MIEAIATVLIVLIYGHYKEKRRAEQDAAEEMSDSLYDLNEEGRIVAALKRGDIDGEDCHRQLMELKSRKT